MKVRGKRLTIRFYKRYTGIARQTRERIQRKLGFERGIMRQRASKHDPACAVAFAGGKAIGWVALFKPGQCDSDIKKRHRSKYYPSVQIFMQKKYRRRGIGTKLIERLCDQMKLWDGPKVIRWQTTKGAEKFYKAAGFVK